MIETLDTVDRQRQRILAYIGRSGCAACDRNEATYQLDRLDNRRRNLVDHLTTYILR